MWMCFLSHCAVAHCCTGTCNCFPQVYQVTIQTSLYCVNDSCLATISRHSCCLPLSVSILHAVLLSWAWAQRCAGHFLLCFEVGEERLACFMCSSQETVVSVMLLKIRRSEVVYLMPLSLTHCLPHLHMTYTVAYCSTNACLRVLTISFQMESYQQYRRLGLIARFFWLRITSFFSKSQSIESQE